MAKASFPTSEIKNVAVNSQPGSITISHGGTNFWLYVPSGESGGINGDVVRASEIASLVLQSQSVSVGFEAEPVNGQQPVSWIKVNSVPRSPDGASSHLPVLLIVGLLAAILLVQILTLVRSRRN